MGEIEEGGREEHWRHCHDRTNPFVGQRGQQLDE